MKKAMLLLLFISYCFNIYTQETWRNITDTYQYRKILPDGQKIWIATEGGLICIDNAIGDTTYFTHANSDIPFTSINDMCIDLQGRLWVASAGAGIASKDGEIWTSYNNTNTDLPNNRAYSITCDSQGNIWAGLMYYLVKYDGESWTTYYTDTLGGKVMFPYLLAVDKDDRVLFGNGDIRAWDGNQLTIYNPENSPLRSRLISFFKTFPDGKTWIGYQLEGMSITDFSTWEYFDTLVPGTPLQKVISFERTSDGDYWVGTYNSGLYYNDGNDWEIIYPDPPLDSLNYILYLTVDENNKLYSAGYPNFTFDGVSWEKMITPGSGMKGNSVRNLLHASDYTAWIANSNGMTGIRNNVITNYRDDDLNTYLSTTCYAEDNNGMVYVAHYHGISRFENNNWTHYYPVEGGSGSFGINNMCFDGDNNLWFTEGYTLYKYNGTNLTSFSWYSNNFPSKEAFCLAVDINGNIVCGIDKGIAVWNGSGWIAILNPDAGNPEYPRTFDIAVRGNDIWTSNQDGLTKYDGTTWTTYNSENSPIPSDYVYQFDFDTKGNIWFMNGINNLVKFDGINFEVISYFESGMNWGDNVKLRIDHLDNIWIGGLSVGISIYNENGIFLNLDKSEIFASKQEIIQLVYPNPTNGELKISFRLPENQSGWIFRITDMHGRLIDSFNLTGNENIIRYSTDNLSSGLYFISVLNASGEGSTRKIQVIR